MFGVALSDSLTAGLLQIPVILLIVDEVSFFFFLVRLDGGRRSRVTQ